MESNFVKFVKENKWFVSFYLIWTFIHIILLINGLSDEYDDSFWPFDEYTTIGDYGFLELFVYEAVPLLIFVLIKLVGNDIKDRLKGE